MKTTTIRVPRETRDHLARLAEERGTTIGWLVGALAARVPTEAQRTARLAADRETVRRKIGVPLTDEEFERAPDVLENIRRIAARKALTVIGSFPAPTPGTNPPPATGGT